MTIVGEKFETAEFFLPEMMAAALAARGILEVLRPRLAAAHAEPVGRVVIGTVKGDLHDIGKNLVCMMLEGRGLRGDRPGPRRAGREVRRPPSRSTSRAWSACRRC